MFISKNQKIKLKYELIVGSGIILNMLQVIDHFSNNGNKEDVMVHVINIDIQDNQEEATIGNFNTG